MTPERLRANRRVALLLAALAALAALPLQAIAQDTPEMLEAMRAMLPPVPDHVPSRDALPADVRRELPEVRIGTHRWHDDPAERFVLIGGRRIEEGGVAGQELWLRQIRADGVVLQFRDVFFFQPR